MTLELNASKLKLTILMLILIGFSICSLTFGVYIQSWTRSSDLLLTSVYDEILTNNERSLRYKLERAAKQFNIVNIAVNGIDKLETPSEQALPQLSYRVSSPIYANIDKETGYIGDFETYFSMRELIFAVLIELLLISSSSVFLHSYLKKQFEEKFKEELISRKKTELAELASKMAHDIRSPLSLLNAVCAQQTPDFENTRKLIGIAVERINNIAEDLLLKKREASLVQIVPDFGKMLDQIVTEKLIEHKEHNRIAFKISIQLAQGIAVLGNANEIKRIISNISNNACESIEHCGTIEFIASINNQIASLKIIDSGKGIPETILSQLGRKEISSKTSGNGLGLFYAKKYLSSINAGLEIQSQVGSGTVVSLSFQRMP